MNFNDILKKKNKECKLQTVEQFNKGEKKNKPKNRIIKKNKLLIVNKQTED